MEAQNYQLNEAKMFADVNELGFDIVIPVSGGSPRIAEIDPEVAKEDGFVPECTEYRDVQELLFADPIH